MQIKIFMEKEFNLNGKNYAFTSRKREKLEEITLDENNLLKR